MTYCLYGNILKYSFTHESNTFSEQNMPFKPTEMNPPPKKKLPFTLRHVESQPIHECLSWPHSPSWMTDWWFTHFCTTTHQSPHWLQLPTFTPKTAPSLQRSSPSSNTPVPRPTPLTILNGIRIQSVVLPQYTFQTDRQTDRPTNTWARRQFYSISTYVHYFDKEQCANNIATQPKNLCQTSWRNFNAVTTNNGRI